MSDDNNVETFSVEIGKKIIQIPHLSFYDLERLRSNIDEINTNSDWIGLPKAVLTLFALQLSPDDPDVAAKTVVELQKVCSVQQMRTLVEKFNEFLVASGFPKPEEVAAAQAANLPATANPGTGTSTDLSPNSPLEGFAGETPTKSNVH